MPTYLRLEGVNLNNFVYDTWDLSTIRGGGLMLLDSVKVLERYLMDECHLSVQTIVHGASTGLFEIENPLGSTTALVTRASDWLRAKYPHATFVLDSVDAPADATFSAVSAQLTNKNRLRQMKAPSLIYPKINQGTSTTPVCDLDLVRPGPQSESSLERKRYGKEQKQKLYERILREDGGFPEDQIPELAYVNDLSELAGDSGQWGNLKDKMAVIVVDGNKIGAKSRSKCKTSHDMKAFSARLRKQQAAFLHSLLDPLNHKPPHVDLSWLNLGAVRLETLVWGGDEVIWVVPAWKGFELLQKFFEHLQNPDWSKVIPGETITFSAGIVFCNHKSPIHSIRTLAKDLCERVKDVESDTNIIAYQVLESFDSVGSIDLEKASRSSFRACDLKDLLDAMPDLRASVPTRKLHELARAKDDTERVRIEKLATKELDPRIATEIKGKWQRWRNIIDLWDYLKPEEGGL